MSKGVRTCNLRVSEFEDAGQGCQNLRMQDKGVRLSDRLVHWTRSDKKPRQWGNIEEGAKF